VKDVKMVIYDCDGVIFESKKANLEYYNYILKKFNIPPVSESNPEHMKVLHTYSNDEVFKYFIQNKALQQKIIKYSKTVDYSKFYNYMEIEKNFFKCCNVLKENKIKIAVATNRSISFAGILKFFGLSKVIDDYVTTLDVKHPKPHPDMLNLLVERNNLKPFHTIFIGDSMVDFQASKSAKIKFIGYKISIENCTRIDDHIQLLEILNIKL